VIFWVDGQSLAESEVNVSSDTPSRRHGVAARHGRFQPVHIWLADQSQSSLSAWLTSPWVALLGLVASVIAVVTVLIAAIKWFIVKTCKASTRRRLARCSAVGIVASVVVLVPLTWQMMAEVVAEVQGGGQLLVGEVFSLGIFGFLGLSVHLYLRSDFSYRASVAYSIFVGVLLCLGYPTILYDAYTSSVWERLLVSATPALTLAMLIATYLAHVIPRAKAKGSDGRQSPASAEGTA
jgi:hypothetical protein